MGRRIQPLVVFIALVALWEAGLNLAMEAVAGSFATSIGSIRTPFVLPVRPSAE